MVHAICINSSYATYTWARVYFLRENHQPTSGASAADA